MISRLLEQLQAAGLLLSDQEIDAFSESQPLLEDEDIADALWLARQIGGSYERTTAEENRSAQPEDSKPINQGELPASPPLPSPSVSVTVPQSKSKAPSEPEEVTEDGLPVQVQAASALPDARGISRGLRPLMRKYPSRTQSTLDAVATVNRIAERDIWLPILKPLPERWFDLELVIESSKFSFIWQETLAEFQHTLECQGAFRNVRAWSIEDVDTMTPKLVSKKQGSSQTRPNRSPKELIDSSGRRLVLLVSDCRSTLWQQGVIHDWLTLWGQYGPAAVVQLLPERLWSQSELDVGQGIQVGALVPGVANEKLIHKAQATRSKIDPTNSLTVPIVTLTATALKQWALVVSAAGRQRTPARLFDMKWVKSADRDRTLDVMRPESADSRIELFEATASPLAQQLALRMAAVPVDMSLVQMIQQEVLPEVSPVHIAEVYASELIQEVNPDQSPSRDEVRYEFAPDVRERLNQLTPIDETLQVFEALSKRIARTLGFEITSFTALLLPKSDWSKDAKAAILPFAQVATEVLYNLGGDYAELARQVEIDAQRHDDWIQPIEPNDQESEDEFEGLFPSLQEFEFIDARFNDEISDRIFPPALQFEEFLILTLETGDETDTLADSEDLESFDVTVVTLTGSGQQWQRQEHQQTAYRYIEQLPSEVPLEMVAIPSGRFVMGSPEDEPERYEDESPQHEVTVESFFMGRYPVTQAQWKAVVALPQVERKLEADPSESKGDDRPVEQVSWHDSVEFCARLSAHTRREYRLPSEAEWEYACRAGTTTPFHFGDMITTVVANYDGDETYADGPSGERRGETTPVGYFGIANGFGLSDMHGNVWEWCQDHWHDNYDDAPTDGSAWEDRENEDEEEINRVVRGGSWFDLSEVLPLRRPQRRSTRQPQLRLRFSRSMFRAQDSPVALFSLSLPSCRIPAELEITHQKPASP